MREHKVHSARRSISRRSGARQHDPPTGHSLSGTTASQVQSTESRVGPGLTPSHATALAGSRRVAAGGGTAALRSLLLFVPWEHASRRRSEPSLWLDVCL